jgi:hypothetical protein
METVTRMPFVTEKMRDVERGLIRIIATKLHTLDCLRRGVYNDFDELPEHEQAKMLRVATMAAGAVNTQTQQLALGAAGLAIMKTIEGHIDAVVEHWEDHSHADVVREALVTGDRINLLSGLRASIPGMVDAAAKAAFAKLETR